MAEELYLTIALRKQVDDLQQAHALCLFVRQQLAPYPNVTITATVSQTIAPPETPP